MMQEINQKILTHVIDGSADHHEFLNKAYDTYNRDVKNAVINAYMIKSDTQSFVKLLTLETNNEIKKHLLRAICISKIMM